MLRGGRFNVIIIIIIIEPLTARVAGAPQMVSQPVSSIFPVLHRPLGPAELQACPFPNVVFPHFLMRTRKNVSKGKIGTNNLHEQ